MGRFSCLIAVLFTGSLAFADINGKPGVTPIDCGLSLFSSADKVCQLFSILGSDLCTQSISKCANTTQEIFTGTNIELGNLSTPKNWTGFGATGSIFTAASLCLLRDLKDAPITSTAIAKTKIGDVKMSQRLQFLSFDRATKVWTGYHIGSACAPAIGCIDMFNQKITVRPVQNNVKGAGKRAGEYEIYTAYGLDVSADAVQQGFNVKIPAFEVPTPYGVVSAHPSFELARTTGMVLAPYANNNSKSLLSGAWGNAKLLELYGRNAGVEMTQIAPTYTNVGAGAIDNRVIGYQSQVALGSRSADPKKAVWTPNTNEYPVRPDLDLSTARSANEKTQNAHLAAGLKIQYSPTDLIPAAIRNNRFISLNFGVYVEPKVGTDMTSQVNLLHTEIAQGKDLLYPGGPVDTRLHKMDQYKSFSLSAGSSAAAMFGLFAGIDLVIHLHVPLLITDIDVDLINIHPQTKLLDSVATGFAAGNRTAYAKTRIQTANATRQLFQEYKTVLNTTPVGTDHIQQCLAAESASAPPPQEPQYVPGQPSDLMAGVEYPCNVCVGMNDFSYKDDNNQTQTISGFLQSMFRAHHGSNNSAGRWRCDNVAKTGCYDMCRFNPANGELTVTRTAVEMQQAGQAQNMPARCR